MYSYQILRRLPLTSLHQYKSSYQNLRSTPHIFLRFIAVILPKNSDTRKDFEQFCKDMGMSKTGACENAIRFYMDKMRKAVKTIK